MTIKLFCYLKASMAPFDHWMDESINDKLEVDFSLNQTGDCHHRLARFYNIFAKQRIKQ